MQQEPEVTNAVLIAREDLTDALSIVRIRPDSGRVPEFHPGQFIRLGLPKAEQGVAAVGRPARPGRIRYTRRAYSIASSPNVTEYMEFFVVRIEEGALTPRLWELAPGDRLWMDSEAKGEFTIEAAPADANMVMVASGTGVAPFMSMLRTYGGQGRWRRFILVHGARYAADLAYRAEMEALVRTDPTVCYIPLVTREPETSDWTGLRGRVQKVLDAQTFCQAAGTHLDPGNCHVFLCGNPQMIDEVEALLVGRGFKVDSREGPGNVHFERYW